jgi:DNA-binding MarR family transcriptional regulator
LLEEALRGYVEGKELSVKALFASAGYSAIGMRYQFDKLRARGFIQLRQSKSDKRRKVVSLTEKALKIYVEILEGADLDCSRQLASNEGSG